MAFRGGEHLTEREITGAVLAIELTRTEIGYAWLQKRLANWPDDMQRMGTRIVERNRRPCRDDLEAILQPTKERG